MHTGNKKCLSDIEIGAYIDGSISAEEKISMDISILECDDCRNEFAMIYSLMNRTDEVISGDAPSSLINKIINYYPERKSVYDIVINRVKNALALDYCAPDFNIMALPLAPALRSEKAGCHEMVVLKKSFDDIDVELDIEKVAGNSCNIKVTIDDIPKKVLKNSLRVELISEGRELVSNVLEEGETILEDIGKGEYIIRIQRKGKVFGQIDLMIT